MTTKTKRQPKTNDPRLFVFCQTEGELFPPQPQLLFVAPNVEAAKFVLLGLEIAAQYQADYDGLSGLTFFDGTEAESPEWVKNRRFRGGKIRSDSTESGHFPLASKRFRASARQSPPRCGVDWCPRPESNQHARKGNRF